MKRNLLIATLASVAWIALIAFVWTLDDAGALSFPDRWKGMLVVATVWAAVFGALSVSPSER